MKKLNKYLEEKTIDYNKLVGYGFVKQDGNYYYEKMIYNDLFKIVIEISEAKQVSKIIDLEFDDEYPLTDVNKYSNSLAIKLNEEYEKIINDLIDKCCISNAFTTNQAKDIIDYVKHKYSNDLEFLWEKFPNTAIYRNKNNGKWYGILLKISANKLGINMQKEIDIIDLRYQSESINNIIDNKKIFPGYHMNKKNWITILLDGSIDINKIYKLIDNSFEISEHR